MTNKEAIEELKGLQEFINGTRLKGEIRAEAFDLAIKALEERPQGEWIEKGKYQVECDQCHFDDCAIKTNFCPNCGAKMEGGGE